MAGGGGQSAKKAERSKASTNRRLSDANRRYSERLQNPPPNFGPPIPLPPRSPAPLTQATVHSRPIENGPPQAAASAAAKQSTGAAPANRHVGKEADTIEIDAQTESEANLIANGTRSTNRETKTSATLTKQNKQKNSNASKKVAGIKTGMKQIDLNARIDDLSDSDESVRQPSQSELNLNGSANKSNGNGRSKDSGPSYAETVKQRCDQPELSDDEIEEVEQADPAIERANRICSTMKGLLNKLRKQIIDDGVLELTPLPGIKLYAANLEKYWAQFFENHLIRVCAMPSTAAGCFDEEMHQLEDLHNELSIQLGVKLSQLEATAIGQCNSASIDTVATHEIKIGRVEIEIFNGDLSRWATIKSLFEQLVHDKAYNAMTKFSYLLDHLQRESEPYQIVDGFEKSPDGYAAAWKALCDTFDNEHRLVMNMLGRFLDLQPVPANPKRTDLMSLVTKTNQLLMSLPAYGVSVESWDVMLIAMLLRKVDNRTKSKWLAGNMSKELPKLAEFLEFIKARAAAIQDHGHNRAASPATSHVSRESTNSHGQKQRNQSENRTAKRSESNSKPKQTNEQVAAQRAAEKCPSCLQHGHRLFNCPPFRAMTPTERMEKARSLKVCIRCLRLNCTPAQCTMAPCSCGGLHNKALCDEHAKLARQRTTALAATNGKATSKAKPRQYF